MWRKRKNIYITFYTYKQSTKGLNVTNGFSFCRDLSREYEDLYIEIDTPPEKIIQLLPAEKYINKIYASLSFPSELNTIYPLLNKKWILGGPLIEMVIQRGIKLPCKLTADSFEDYLKQPLSSDFDPYFIDFAKNFSPEYLYYNCSLGHGCYWSKCKFCDNYYFKFSDFIRPNIEKILQQIPQFKCKICYVHTCISAMPPATLKTTWNVKIPSNVILSYALRADSAIRDAFATFQQAVSTNHIYNFGLESFSQTGINLLNKSIDLNVLLEIVEIIMQAKTGRIFLSIMDHYPFTNKQILEESLATIEKFAKLVKKYGNDRLFIYNAGPTMWENQAAISEFTDNFIIVPYTSETKIPRFKDYKTIPRYYKLCDKYLAAIPEDSTVFKYNQQIALALTKTDINLVGNDFISLKNIEHRKSFTHLVDYYQTKVI